MLNYTTPKFLEPLAQTETELLFSGTLMAKWLEDVELAANELQKRIWNGGTAMVLNISEMEEFTKDQIRLNADLKSLSQYSYDSRMYPYVPNFVNRVLK